MHAPWPCKLAMRFFVPWEGYPLHLATMQVGAAGAGGLCPAHILTNFILLLSHTFFTGTCRQLVKLAKQASLTSRTSLCSVSSLLTRVTTGIGSQPMAARCQPPPSTFA